MGKLNVANRTLFTYDNLAVMQGINSETIDLIYLDPPFNSKRNYAAPIGSQAAGQIKPDLDGSELKNKGGDEKYLNTWKDCKQPLQKLRRCSIGGAS